MALALRVGVGCVSVVGRSGVKTTLEMRRTFRGSRSQAGPHFFEVVMRDGANPALDVSKISPAPVPFCPVEIEERFLAPKSRDEEEVPHSAARRAPGRNNNPG